MDRVDPNWKNPCILECLLRDERKSKLVLKALNHLGFKIELYTDNRWFDIKKV